MEKILGKGKGQAKESPSGPFLIDQVSLGKGIFRCSSVFLAHNYLFSVPSGT
jgi:hypothetical protein